MKSAVKGTGWKILKDLHEETIVLTSKEGIIVHVPPQHKYEVEGMVLAECTNCINSYIESLPEDCIFTE